MLDKTDGRILAGDWTEIRVADLKRMWAEGSTAGKIAGELGGVSRSAVLGKIHRLGISETAPKSKRALTAGRARRRPGWRPVQWDTAQTREERLRRRREREALKRLTRPQPLPASPVSPDFLNITFDQLEPELCRYPTTDGSPYLFCGLPIVRDSYCAHCFRITHAPGRAA